MNGLDARRDAIVSAGWVPIRQGRLRMGKSQLVLVNHSSPVGKSAVIHEITDHERRLHGVPIQEAIARLLVAAAGHVWLFHFAKLDLAFLRQACKRLGIRVPLPHLCTLRLAQAHFQRRNLLIDPSELRLPALRKQLGLPVMPEHDARVDAVATGELFQAMTAKWSLTDLDITR